MNFAKLLVNCQSAWGIPAQAVIALLHQDQRKRKAPEAIKVFASTSSEKKIIQDSKRQRRIDTEAVSVQIFEVESSVLRPKKGRGRPMKL